MHEKMEMAIDLNVEVRAGWGLGLKVWGLGWMDPKPRNLAGCNHKEKA